MASMNDLAKTKAPRILLMGHPGTAKTGSLACLANAGYNLRVLDFDGNTEPLFQYIKPENYKNVEIISLEDDLVAEAAGTAQPMKVKGTPMAFRNALKHFDDWEWDLPEAERKGIGGIMSWGPRDILVLDSLTAMGEAAMWRILAMNSRSTLNRRIQDWGTAAAEQLNMIKKITAAKVPCAVIVISHLKIIAPKSIEEKDDDTNKELKTELAQLIPSRYYPSALGQGLPTTIAGEFPVALIYETKFIGQKEKRIIRTVPRPEIDAKLPAVGIPSELPVEDGLLTIFKALTTD